MRILAIRGKNLASLEGEFEIDFTAEPLKSAGIFAITGSTGSGKSTILDALCLALYAETPRSFKAGEKGIHVADVKGAMISQGDSRNILRRGTSDGYAEVDFVSLGGEKYRSRWSVRRAYNKVGGSLQDSGLKLTNLTTNFEEQGTKTALLEKIKELIGLTFNQFTRAVLLAQGDFATFLKSNEGQKADLLEKLTNTEIYSQISMIIYNKSKEAGEELKKIKERIEGIELLKDEDIENLTVEKQTNAEEIQSLNKEIESLKNKIKWIDDESTLNQALATAELELKDAEQKIEDAKPRNEYLAQIDSVQEIRDSFNEQKTVSKQLAENEKNLAEQRKIRESNQSLFQQCSEKVRAYELDLESHNNEFITIEPQIKQARELDIRIVGAKSISIEAEKEFRQATESKVKINNSIVATQNSIKENEEKLARTEKWFEDNNRFKEVVPKKELIISLLENNVTFNSHKETNTQLLIKSKKLYENELNQLTELTKEAERLNNLLPAEILSLRAKLEEGVPCPVCGSLHHPASKITGEISLEEVELNKAKKDVGDKISVLNDKIEKQKKEIIQLESSIKSCVNQYNDNFKKLEVNLESLPDWKKMFEEGNLQETIKFVAEKWSKGEVFRNQTKEQITNLQTTLKLAQEQFADAEKLFISKEEKYKKTKSELENLQGNRGKLLGSKNADEVEKTYNHKKTELTNALSKWNEEKNKLIASDEKQKGIINQISQEIEKLSKRSDSLNKVIDEWISADRNITIEQLTDLLSKDVSWIKMEREYLNGLNQNKTAATATLIERKKALETHNQSENKPKEEETKDNLQLNCTIKQKSVQQKTVRNAEIDVAFANHKKGKEQTAKYEKEFKEKSVLADNWKKLNDLFGSADGTKFKVLAQSYTLDALLSYANKHLQELSKRYVIERIPKTLALQVVDLDMLGETRTVHSLSGGESFLVSLALALGLSSLSSNRMKVESLFIDEGFGSLDIDTLRIALDALESLQTQGRKIGVISHVAEMTERISAQIHVVKSNSGKSKIVIDSK